MAIKRQIGIDRIIIHGEHRFIDTRLKVEFVDTETGQIVGRSHDVRLPTQKPDAKIAEMPDVEIEDTVTPMPDDVKNRLVAVAEQEWTQEVKDKWTAKKQAEKA